MSKMYLKSLLIGMGSFLKEQRKPYYLTPSVQSVNEVVIYKFKII